jgi:hypothetical protein
MFVFLFTVRLVTDRLDDVCYISRAKKMDYGDNKNTA